MREHMVSVKLFAFFVEAGGLVRGQPAHKSLKILTLLLQELPSEKTTGCVQDNCTP